MKGVWLGAAAGIRRQEWAFAGTMAVSFLLVITSFWILKPLKKALFVQFYDASGLSIAGFQLDAAQAELIAKVLNMIVAAVAAIVFGAASSRLVRERLMLAFTVCFGMAHAGFAFLLSAPAAATVWGFYLYGDLFSTLMVVSFFAFLNDSVSRDAAKRLYGLTGLGGVAGGAVGSLFLAAWIEELEPAGWMWVCVGLAALIAATSMAAGFAARRLPEGSRARRDHDAKPAEPQRVSEAALGGAKLALRSRYLLAVIVMVGFYELVSTLLDFQFVSAVQHFLDGDAIGAHFSRVYAVTNSLALLVQLFLTSFVMTRVGVGAALLVLPVAIFGGSVAFLAAPGLWTGSLLPVADNAFAYSIHQSAKESLYVPTSAAEKYQAKAFIDMWVQRFAKAVAVVSGLGITLVFQSFGAVRWLSLLTLVLLLLWLPAARYAGRRFETWDDAPRPGRARREAGHRAPSSLARS